MTMDLILAIMIWAMIVVAWFRVVHPDTHTVDRVIYFIIWVLCIAGLAYIRYRSLDIG